MFWKAFKVFELYIMRDGSTFFFFHQKNVLGKKLFFVKNWRFTDNLGNVGGMGRSFSKKKNLFRVRPSPLSFNNLRAAFGGKEGRAAIF
jgi:hypothetical protein